MNLRFFWNESILSRKLIGGQIRWSFQGGPLHLQNKSIAGHRETTLTFFLSFLFALIHSLGNPIPVSSSYIDLVYCPTAAQYDRLQISSLFLFFVVWNSQASELHQERS